MLFGTSSVSGTSKAGEHSAGGSSRQMTELKGRSFFRGDEHNRLPIMARRFVAILTCLMTLHLTMVGGDSVCAKHAGHLSGMQHGNEHAPQAGPGADQMGANGAPCETPILPTCCHALTSCSTLSMGVSSAQSRVIVERVPVPQSANDLPLSEIITPDPPPPRV